MDFGVDPRYSVVYRIMLILKIEWLKMTLRWFVAFVWRCRDERWLMKCLKRDGNLPPSTRISILPNPLLDHLFIIYQKLLIYLLPKIRHFHLLLPLCAVLLRRGPCKPCTTISPPIIVTQRIILGEDVHQRRRAARRPFWEPGECLVRRFPVCY